MQYSVTHSSYWQYHRSKLERRPASLSHTHHAHLSPTTSADARSSTAEDLEMARSGQWSQDTLCVCYCQLSVQGSHFSPCVSVTVSLVCRALISHPVCLLLSA